MQVAMLRCLPSHLGENMVTHMSLLARENRKLKQQLREQGEAHKKEVQMLRDDTTLFVSNVPPILILGRVKISKPFYSHIGGYKLQLVIRCVSLPPRGRYECKYMFLDSEFKVPPSATLYITTQITKFQLVKIERSKQFLKRNIAITSF